MAWELCNKSDVISIHSVPEASLQDWWSDAVEAMIRQHLSAPNLGRSVAVVNELHDGTGTPLLLLDKPPVLSVSALKINELPEISQGYLYLPAEYRVLSNGIELLNQTFPKGHLNIAVTYVSGSSESATMDPIIRLCAVAMLIAILNYQGRRGADSSIKWGNTEKQEGNPTPTFEVGLVDHLAKIMRRLLRRNRVRMF